MKQQIFRPYYLVTLTLLLTGCAYQTPTTSGSNDFPRFHSNPETQGFPNELSTKTIDLPLDMRLTSGNSEPAQKAKEPEKRYSFVINKIEIHEALRLFSRAYELSLVVDPDVSGILDVEFDKVTLAQALSMMLDALDYYWEVDEDVIRVRSRETRQFTVDYLRLTRAGSGSSSAKVSSGSSSSGSSGGDSGAGGEEAGNIVIEHSDVIEFWSELDTQIKQFLSEEGQVVMNRLSGTIFVTDQHARVETVAEYIEQVNRSIHRQVDIEVRIFEVRLDDTTALGVDWSRIANSLSSGTNVEFDIDGIVTSPAGGITALGNVLNLSASKIDSGGDQPIGAVVAALKRQGDVELVSQPHVRTMNNQTSMIKVGTDRTFFRREQSTDSTSAGSLTTSTDVPQVVTEGVVLSITPQIADNGWIMMDVSPVITRVSSVTTVENDRGVIQSSAPNLDVSQVSSIVRAKSGDTVVIGGLIQGQTAFTKQGIPGLSEAGPVGRLFGGTYDASLKKELIMVLKPVIVDQP